MDRPPLARFFQRWQFAFAVSLLLHAGLVGICFLMRSGGGNGEARSRSGIDTRAPGSRMEVTLALVQDRPRPVARAQSKPEQVIRPEPSVVPQMVKSTATSQAVRSNPPLSEKSGGNEEQEQGSDSAPANGTWGGIGFGTTSFFQITTQARRVVYVIDHSASMGINGSFNRAKHELVASLKRLPTDARFQVVVYNRTAELLSLGAGPDLAAATPETIRRAADSLERFRAEGGTDYLPALKRALALQPEVIFFLTDGDELRLDQIQVITQINRGRAVIHTIELSGPRPSHGNSRLEVLARANQGSYRFVPLEH